MLQDKDEYIKWFIDRLSSFAILQKDELSIRLPIANVVTRSKLSFSQRIVSDITIPIKSMS